MRIAFVGKGGSGKTTTAAVFSRYLAAQGRPVVAIDADINQHLAVALGHDGPAAAAARRRPAVAQGPPARRQPAHRLGRRDDQDDAARAAAPGCSTSIPRASC